MEFRADCCAEDFLETVLKTKHLFTLDNASWEHLVACSSCKYRLIRIRESERKASKQEYPSIEGGVVLRKIGSGGGGTVWLFLNQADGLAFEAIKVLGQHNCNEKQTENENASLTFQAERERLARLDDGNIVVSYKRKGWTENDRRPWISMTFLRGAPTSLFAQYFKLSLRQRVQLARDICRSIESIHRLGVIHCDLKPGNVVVTRGSLSNQADDNPLTWTVRPVDFGCSCDWHDTVDGKRVRKYLSHVAGTPGYICPELLGACDDVGESISVRPTIDVYSLGVMLFELVTGCLPWSPEQYEKLRHDLTREPILEDWKSTRVPAASDTLAAARRQANDSSCRPLKAIAHRASSLVGALDFIVAKAVAIDPQKRFQSAGELANQLDDWLTYRPIKGHTETLPVFVKRWSVGNPVKTTIASAMLFYLVGISILVVVNAESKELRGSDPQVQIADRLAVATAVTAGVEEVDGPNETNALALPERVNGMAPEESALFAGGGMANCLPDHDLSRQRILGPSLTCRLGIATPKNYDDSCSCSGSFAKPMPSSTPARIEPTR